MDYPKPVQNLIAQVAKLPGIGKVHVADDARYAHALLAATKREDLVQPKKVPGLSAEQMARMEREMDALHHALEQVKAGHGQVVAAMADPGVGKSRLFYEFKALSHSGCMVLESVLGLARQSLRLLAGNRVIARILRDRQR